MHLRAIALITLLLVVQGWCKPSKDVDDFDDYNDDAQADENDDYSQNEDDDESPDAIEEPPQIVSEPLSKRVLAGTTVTLPCLTENADSFAVVWKKGNQFLYTGSSSMTEEPTRIVRTANNSLVIHNANVNDTSDNYTCSIITSDTPITITHRLVVLDPATDRSPSTTTTTTMKTTTPQMVPTPSSTPWIQVVPADKIDVKRGNDVTLGCNPLPRIQFRRTEMKWYHENKKLNNDSHTTMHGNNITIFNVGRHDAGLYQCLADNGMDNPPIAAIHLTVHYPPEIEAEPDIVHTGAGIESEITCIVHAHPRANVTWYKNQKELPKRGGGGGGGKISQREKKSRYTLRIMHTSEQDFGDYTCLAKNGLGQANRTISLTGAPSQANIFEAELMTDNNNNYILKWRLESYSPIAQYKLKYRRKGDKQWEEIEPRVKDGNGNQYIGEHVIDGLEAGNYEAILEARNSFGWSPPSDTLTFKKEEPPKEKTASVTGSSAVSIRQFWTIPVVSLLVVCAFRNL